MDKEKIYYDLPYIHKEELKILLVFKVICDKYKLKYSLSGGTLIGAVRHKGFIPWDDDVDVMMPRKDYEKFAEVCMEELPEGYFLQTFHTDHDYLNGFAKLLNKNIPAFIEETDKLNIDKGICIDIFPIDRLPKQTYKLIYNIFRLSVFSVLKYSLMEQKNESVFKMAIHKFFKGITRYITTYKINLAEERIKTKYNRTNSDISFADYVKPPYKLRKKDIYPYHIFEEYSEIQFENESFSVLKEYEIYLEITYGDYMKLPPKEERIPLHNFYYYKET